MYLEIDGRKVYYQVLGKGSPVVLLHGWGGKVESMKPVFDHLARRHRVYALDFPGFGRSDLPPAQWGSRDYADDLVRFLDGLGLEQADLIGHSFGGRVALNLAAARPERVRHLVLVDSAGIPPQRGLRYYARVGLAKSVKAVFGSPLFGEAGQAVVRRFYRLTGSSDYREAGPLRATFVKVVNEDLRPLLPRVSAPTLLIWGEKDQETPLRDAKIMVREIPDAGLVVFPGAGHFSYLDDLPRFCRILLDFLEDA